MRISVFRVTVLAALFAMAGRATADDAKSQWTLALHGFLGGSLEAQDAKLGPSAGGQPMWVDSQIAADKLMLSGDIRQNRLNFSVTGPQTFFGATPKGVVEIDFFGGNSSGGFGDVSVFPRMRVVYAELAWENTTFRFGQTYQLVLGAGTITPFFLPQTVGHIAFPVTFAAGSLGWRYPGFEILQKMQLDKDSKLEFALQIQRAAWANPANPGVATGSVGTGGVVTSTVPFFTDGIDLGSASGLPAIEARVAYAFSKNVYAFVTGHWSQVDPSGWGVPYNGAIGCTAGNLEKGGCSNLDVVAGVGGVKVVYGPFTFTGAGYVGKNTAPLLGEMIQFQNLSTGDIHEWGAWGQAGVNVTDELSVWALIGTEHNNYAETIAAYAVNKGFVRLQNTASGGMLRYMMGGYALALEYTHWYTKTVNAGNLDGNQLMLSGFYFF